MRSLIREPPDTTNHQAPLYTVTGHNQMDAASAICVPIYLLLVKICAGTLTNRELDSSNSFASEYGG